MNYKNAVALLSLDLYFLVYSALLNISYKNNFILYSLYKIRSTHHVNIAISFDFFFYFQFWYTDKMIYCLTIIIGLNINC